MTGPGRDSASRRTDALALARDVPGFLPEEEGLALHQAGREATTVGESVGSLRVLQGVR